MNHSKNSTLRLFADDCILYRKIESSADQEVLNVDLKNLYNWSKSWKMSFNTTKCKILSITNKRNTDPFPYKLDDVHLEHVESHRYLGVTCNNVNQLQWSEHSYNVANKANRTLGIVRRVLKPSR